MKTREDTIGVTQLQAELSRQLKRVRETGRRLVVASHGKPQAVLIGYADYQGLISQAEEPARDIDPQKWKEGEKARREVAQSIASMFDAEKLSRKGQKEYKRRAVERLEKKRKGS